MNKVKDIKVFNKRGKELAPTSRVIAKTLVAREKAVWIKEGESLTLLSTKSDFKKLRKRVISEEKRKCYICGETILEDEPATIDHVDPKSRYGKDNRKNLRCCCKRCNDDKGNTGFLEYCNEIFKNKKVYSYINLGHLEIERRRYIKQRGQNDSKDRISYVNK